MNLRTVPTFNDRLTYRRLYLETDLFTRCSDKIAVRAYVRERLGEQFLIPLIAVVDDIDRFDFSALPSRFIMKSNHASGQVAVVPNRDDANFDELRTIAKSWLQVDYSKLHHEIHYREIAPTIFFEELLYDGEKVPVDYKFHCFRTLAGSFEYIIQVDSDRFTTHTRDFFDANWNPIELEQVYPNSAVKPEKPASIEALARAAEILSRDFNYVRVDLYEFNEQIYFGELTFVHEAGLGTFQPKSADYEWAGKFDEDWVFYRGGGQ